MKGLKLIEIEKIISSGGCLSFFEKGKEFDFDIKRIYYIYKFCEENTRGFHAHKNLKQILFCPHGKIEIKFKNRICQEKKYILDSPTKIVIVEEGYWREFTSLKEESILCVGASEIYTEEDYIRDFEEYIKWGDKKDENTI